MPLLEKGLVLRNTQVGRDMFEVEFIAPLIAAECKPGQFVHVRVGAVNEPLLRRPLSIYDVDRNLGSITLLYKVVGQGTEMMTRIMTKDYLDVMGPLGNGFTLEPDCSRPLLVGGGVGIAPLVYLARVLREKGGQVRALHGTDARRQMVAFNKFRQLEVDFMPATTDGSTGFKGVVTDLLWKKIQPESTDFIYTCGPEPMMAEVQSWAGQHGIRGEVSLEEHMACGVGACLGCARKLKQNDEYYIKICKDGPVFGMGQIELQKGGS